MGNVVMFPTHKIKKPKVKQKCRNELNRRGIQIIKVDKPAEES